VVLQKLVHDLIFEQKGAVVQIILATEKTVLSITHGLLLRITHGLLLRITHGLLLRITHELLQHR
jgi:hypothetical protein